MKIIRHKLHLLLLLSFILLIACNKEDTLEETGVKLHFKSDLMSPDSSGSMNVRVDEAVFGIEKINLKSAGTDTADIGEKAIFNGPYRLNLIDGNIDPRIRYILAEPGDYEIIEILPGGFLKERSSIVIRGAVRNGNMAAWIPFELITDHDFPFNVDNGARGFTVHAGSVTELTVYFYLNHLLNHIDFSSAKKESDGSLSITVDRNPQILSLLINGMKSPGVISFGEGAFEPGPPVLDEDDEPQPEVPGENPGEDQDPGTDDPLTGGPDDDGGSNDDGSGSGDDGGNDDGSGSGGDQGGNDDPGTGSGDDGSGSGDDGGSDDGSGSGGDQGGNDDTGTGSGDDGSGSGDDGGSNDGSGSGGDQGGSDDSGAGGTGDDGSGSGDDGGSDDGSGSGDDSGGDDDSGTDGTGDDDGNDDSSGKDKDDDKKGDDDDDDKGKDDDDDEKKKTIMI